MPAEVLKTLKAIIRGSSLSRFQIHAKQPNAHVSDAPMAEDPTLGRCLSLIMIGGDKIRITIRVQYKTGDVQLITQHVFQKDPKEISLEQSNDFMSELCNVIATRIKQQFKDRDLFKVSLLYLPLTMSGFDSLHHPVSDSQSSFSDSWFVNSKIGDKDIKLKFSTFVEILGGWPLHIKDNPKGTDVEPNAVLDLSLLGDVDFF